MKRLFGFLAMAGLMLLAAPAERAQAVSLIESGGHTSAVRNDLASRSTMVVDSPASAAAVAGFPGGFHGGGRASGASMVRRLPRLPWRRRRFVGDPGLSAAALLAARFMRPTSVTGIASCTGTTALAGTWRSYPYYPYYGQSAAVLPPGLDRLRAAPDLPPPALVGLNTGLRPHCAAKWTRACLMAGPAVLPVPCLPLMSLNGTHRQ